MITFVSVFGHSIDNNWKNSNTIEGYQSEKRAIRINGNVTSSQSDFRVNAGKLPEGRENTSNQARLVLGLLSDWLRGWHEFPEPITERDEAIPKKKNHESQSTKNCPFNWPEIFRDSWLHKALSILATRD